jgi:galactokinase
LTYNFGMDISRLKDHFKSQFNADATFVARAPGRVNLIGEHTDYNDGFVLPIAIDRDVALAGAGRADGRIRVYSVDFDQSSEFSLDHIDHDSAHEWSNYLRGVADVLQKDGYRLHGFDAVMQGEVPIASGLSSSAATEMAMVMALTAAASATASPLVVGGARAAQLAQRAENQFVGVNCGIMDQFISSLGKAQHALMIDCRSLDYQLVPVPAGATVLVVDTTAPRTLAGSAYNQRRSECEEGVRLLGVPSLRDISPADFDRRKGTLPEIIARRCDHIVHESQRVLDAVEALKRGDVAAFGRLMYQSHESLRDLYEVSSSELDAVVEIARGEPGVYGARMTGAGFGGCAIALVQDEYAAALASKMQVEYPPRTGRTPKVYACVASDGASWWGI